MRLLSSLLSLLFSPLLSLLLLCQILLAAHSVYAANATVYRWTDDNGQLHFSSQPPHGQKSEAYQIRVDQAADAPSPAIKSPSPQANSPQANPSQENVEQTDPQPLDPQPLDPQQAQKYCQQAQENKRRLSVNFSRRYKQKDGSYRPLTDDERQRYMKKAQQVIRRYCQ